MNCKNYSRLFVLGFAVFAASIFMTEELFAQRHGGGTFGRPGNGLGHMAGQGLNLTEDQKAELQSAVESLREQGATREEIHAAVAALFQEWGIEMPENFAGRMGKRGRKGEQCPQLTEEQREQLHTTIQSLRDADATREEIHAAAQELFETWGLEMPEHRAGQFGRFHGAPHSQLSKEQRETLRTTVQGLRDADATRDKIRAAVDALYEEWGIEKPDHGSKGRRGRNGQSWMQDLTEEQRQTIRDMTRAMREAGATRDEIHDAVQKQLDEWGIDGGENGQGLLQENEKPTFSAPNPFNPTTTITYSLEKAGPVSVKVYNTQGQLIRTLVDGEAYEGSHRVMWDGRNDAGEPVSSGMYFYKVHANGTAATERMTLMK